MRKLVCYFVIMCFSLTCPGVSILPAVIAAELAAGEEQTFTSKEVLKETLNNLKTNLAEGLPIEEGDLALLENMKYEIAEQISSMESVAEEVRGILPESNLSDFEIRFAEKISSLEGLMEGINHIILDPSIEQIDIVLDLIESIDPEPQGEILAGKAELPNRVDKKISVFKERPSKPTGAPVTEADLAETDEILITPEIESLALELGHNIVAIFTWVRNNIDYEPYFGSLKGSTETLVDMAGNDSDTSSLLLALLRAAGIPSRYVRGNVQLKIEDLMDWVGAKTPEAAVAIFQRNKVPTSTIYKFENIEGVIFDHIWVEAFDGHNWRLMDPSFKTYVYAEGIGFDGTEDMPAIIEDSATISEDTVLFDYETISTSLKTQSSNYMNIVGDNMTLDEVLGKREILISEKSNLPPYLARGIIGDRKPAEEFSEMPEDMRFKVKVILPGGNEYMASISEIAGKRMSVVYVAATIGDQYILDFFEGIYNVPFPSLTVQMKPVLQIDGETVAEGTGIGLGLSGQSIQIGVLRPGTTSGWEFSNKPLTAGSRYNIFISTQKTSLHEVKKVSNNLEEEIESLPEDSMESMASDNATDSSLFITNMLYFGLVDTYSDIASRQLRVKSVNHISFGVTCNEIKPVGFFGIIWSISRGGAHIDVMRNVVCPTSLDGIVENEIRWMKSQGAIGTNLEHTVHTMLYEIEAISTGKVFQEAAYKGIPIHMIYPAYTENGDIDTVKLEADLAKISAHSVVKSHIRSYVKGGYVAMIPQKAVKIGNWSGSGWVVIDEQTGAAGYMICGGLHGENTPMISGGSLSEAVNNLYITILKIAKEAWGHADSHIIACTLVMAAVVHLLIALGALAMGSYYGVIYYFIGTILLVAIAVFIINCLKDYYVFNLRGRKYAYA